MSDIDRYLAVDSKSVEGWLRPQAAALIAELARAQEIRGSVGEIGVHHGKLFILLSLCRRPGETGVALDLFEDQERNIDHSGSGDRGRFERNLARLDPAASSVSVQSRDSTTVTSSELLAYAGERYRLFSVDGGHTAAITLNDLTIASGSLEEGGILILDDYFNVSWPGVSEGANRFLLGDPPVVAFATGHGKMFFTQPSFVDTYRGTVESAAKRLGWKLTEQPFHGRPIMIAERRAPQSFARRGARMVRSTAWGRKLTDPVVQRVRGRS